MSEEVNTKEAELRKLELEKQELNKLINKGIEFHIVADVVEEKKKFFFFKKHQLVKKRMKFKIEEPTLSTLDRIAAESIDFAITEAKMDEVNDITKGIQFASKYTRKCARIIAIAVIGSDVQAKYYDKRFTTYNDEEEVERLTDLFMKTIKPSQMFQLYNMILISCNVGDFMNSIRLITLGRLTNPNRIEKKPKD